MALADHPKIKKAIKTLQPVCPFGFIKKDGTFKILREVMVEGKYASYLSSDGTRKLVSKKIQKNSGKRVRWLNRLGFISGHGDFIGLKDYVSDRYGVVFNS